MMPAAPHPAPSAPERPPFFTVALSCCNVAPYLEECFDSILSQPFADWECVAWVEKSGDGTEAVARAFAARDSRIRVFTGPKTGSCSVSRNKGIELARGEYIFFVDGDDCLAPDALPRLHDRIAERPGADLYPCALLHFVHATGKTLKSHDNYPKNLNRDMTGPEATLAQDPRTYSVMLQAVVFRRAFLLRHGLSCIPGLRCQDLEIHPRALYLAERVVPLHETACRYRIRDNSVQQSWTGRSTYFYKDYAAVFRSLLAFYARVAESPDFDVRIGGFWAQAWISTHIAYRWFSPRYCARVSRDCRVETLQALFADGFAVFDRLRRQGGLKTRVCGWWIECFVRHPLLRWAAEGFFRTYFGLHALKARLHG
jgi:glycosyltransferase involved in cell wall biosynthesis